MSYMKKNCITAFLVIFTDFILMEVFNAFLLPQLRLL